jgi:hypothetical protein
VLEPAVALKVHCCSIEQVLYHAVVNHDPFAINLIQLNQAIFNTTTSTQCGANVC